MPTLYLLKEAFKVIALPPVGPLLVTLIGLAIAGRHPQRGRLIATAGVVLLLVLSMPMTGGALVRLLDRSPPLDLGKAGNVQAIVILGGGTRPYAAEYGGATVGVITLERVRYGAALARRTGLPVLVSGGPMHGAPAEALLMRDVLVREYGVPVRWLETRSRNTHENAARSATLLRSSGVTRVILVGHSFDFPRSRREFELAGIAVVPAPIGIPGREPLEFTDLLPGLGGLSRSYYALYEMFANLAFYVRNGPAAAPAHAV